MCLQNPFQLPHTKSYDRPITSQWPIPALGTSYCTNGTPFRTLRKTYLQCQIALKGTLSLFVSSYHLVPLYVSTHYHYR